MRKLLLITFLVLNCLLIVAKSPLDKRVYFYGNAGLSVSFAGGLDAFEERKDMNDFVLFARKKGAKASGSILPYFSPALGYGADIKFADEFYFQPELAFSMKGLNKELSYEIGDTSYSLIEKVRVSYLDMNLIVRYQPKFYLSIYTGLAFGLNIYDKVHTNIDYRRGNETLIYVDKKQFLNERYSASKKPYIPSYVLGVGLWYHNALEFKLRIQRTLNIFKGDSPEINFWSIQPTVSYYFGKPSDNKRRLYAKGGIGLRK